MSKNVLSTFGVQHSTRCMLKCDFHMHSLEDPKDVLRHDAFELVDHAARLGYQVLALTLHGRVYFPPRLQEHAESVGILMIPGIECYVDRKEVLLLGVSEGDVKGLRTLKDLRVLKRDCGDSVLVIAPHPFYGLGQCLGRKLVEYADVFDAVELCHFYTRWWNPNKKAMRVAREIGKPMLACSDSHELDWLRHHFCRLQAEPTREAVFEAIRKGRIENVTRPMTEAEIVKRTLWHAWHAPRSVGRQWGVVPAPRSRRS